MLRSIADIEALERVPLAQRLRERSVPALLARGAAFDPQKTAIRYLPEGRVEAAAHDLSYRGLLSRVRRVARVYRSLGVGRDDAVALLLPNLPQAYVALLGAMCAGVAMPMNWMLRPAQIESLLRAARPKVLVSLGRTDGFDIESAVLALPPDLRAAMTWLQVGGDGSFDAVCDQGPDAALDEEPGESHTAAYIHTGGTTGTPKLARVLHGAIAYKCWAYRELLDQRPEHVALGVSPLFHVGGIVLRTLHPLACGMRIVVPGALGLRDKEVLRRYWRIVAAERVTELPAVPTSLGALAQIDPEGADLSSLRGFAVTGSSTLPAAVAQRFERRTGVKLLGDYGLTEYTATVTMPLPDGELPAGSSGLRLPYTRVRIARVERGAIVGKADVGEIGEVLVQGPSLAGGYLDARLSDGVFLADGWLRTGDLGRLDEAGHLFITGRAKDLIIRGGHNIDPRIIEETLQAHDDVALVAAVGRLDAYAGELPVAYVQLREGATTTGDALKDFARERIAERAAAPVAVFVVSEMPLTAAGKIAKPLLRERGACEVISALMQGAAPDVRNAVTAAADPEHGTVYTVIMFCSPDTRLADRLNEVLGTLPCRCRLQWSEATAAEARA